MWCYFFLAVFIVSYANILYYPDFFTSLLNFQCSAQAGCKINGINATTNPDYSILKVVWKKDTTPQVFQVELNVKRLLSNKIMFKGSHSVKSWPFLSLI
jgi:hypothetical protein